MAFLVAGCRTSPPNPFTQEGMVRLFVINKSISSARGTVLGGDQEYRLGLIVSLERRRFDIPWVGSSQFVVMLTRTGGGRRHRTFPVQVRPGDELVLTLESNLNLSRLRFGRPGG
jgi:hypothetical protein